MAITHTFKGSYKNGYYAYIEDNKLVIGEDHGREEHNHSDYKTPHAVVPQVHSCCHI